MTAQFVPVGSDPGGVTNQWSELCEAQGTSRSHAGAGGRMSQACDWEVTNSWQRCSWGSCYLEKVSSFQLKPHSEVPSGHQF